MEKNNLQVNMKFQLETELNVLQVQSLLSKLFPTWKEIEVQKIKENI